MSKKIVISADSVCDLPKELCEELGIFVLPLTVTLGENSYRDGVEIDAAKIFTTYKESGLLPKTSAISPAEFMDFFQPFVDDGCEVVHITIGSKLSGTYQNCCIAAADLDGVYPVDSCLLSTGEAMVVMEACRLRDEGRSAKEIAEALPEFIARVDTSFVLDTLEFIWKGGRCSGVAALGANLLGIKPALEMADGGLRVCKKYRGSIEKVYLKYAAERLAAADKELDHCFITYSEGMSEDSVEALKKVVAEAAPFKKIYVAKAGCTVSSHCGPKTMGIIFVRK
ncbi:MAG: DegV family protein [Oscillospiraceae bacterium]|nr:DegV family protein [Oscillospiraceae bacterium]